MIYRVMYKSVQVSEVKVAKKIHIFVNLSTDCHSNNKNLNEGFLLTGASDWVSCDKDEFAMLNPTNGDPGHVVVNYVEEYLDLVESLPFDLQRSVSLMKEIDAKYQGKSARQCGQWCARHKSFYAD